MGETLGGLPDEFFEHGTIDGTKTDLLEKVVKLTGVCGSRLPDRSSSAWATRTRWSLANGSDFVGQRYEAAQFP